MARRFAACARLAGLLAIFGGLGSLYVSVGELEFSSYQWLRDSNPAHQHKRYLDREFNRGEVLAVVVQLPPAQSFFDAALLDELDEIVARMRAFAHVAKVNSPLHATTVIRDTADTLHILTFREALQQGLLDLPAYARRLAASRYQSRLISDRGQLVIPLTLDLDFAQNNAPIRAAVIARAEKLLRASAYFSDYGFAGETELHHRLDTLSQENVVKLLPIAAFGLLILLAIFLRNVRYVAITCTVTLLTLLLAFHINRLLNIPFNVLSASLPILIITISVADSIHIIKRWQDLLGTRAAPTAARPSLNPLLKKCWQQTWRPCFFTSLTSATGFGVFYFSELIPLRDFGAVAFIAVLLAWPTILCTTLGLLYILRPTARARLDWQWFGLASGEFVARNTRRILMGGVGVFAAFCIALPFAKTETNFLQVFFHPESPTRQTFHLVDETLSGSGRVDIILRGAGPESFNQLDWLERIQHQVAEFSALEKTRAVRSLLEPLEMVHKPLGGVGDLPTTENALAQELLFLEFSRNDVSADVLSEFVDFDYRNSRISLYTDNMKSSATEQLLGEITPILDQQKHQFRSLNYFITGANVYAHRLSGYVLDAQAKSIALTLLVVWLAFLAQFGVRLGSIALAASCAPVMGVIALQILARIPFDFSTVMVASVAMGLAIDSTIHYLHRFNFHRGARAPIARANADTRQPIFTTTLILVAGFLLLTQSELQVVDRFSVLLGGALILSLPATFLLLPALLNRFVLNLRYA